MIKRLEEHQCIVSVLDGRLKRCGFTPEGLPEMFAGLFVWRDVEANASIEFLNAANSELGTHFSPEDIKNGV